MQFQRGRIDKPTSTGPGTITGEMMLDSMLQTDGVGVNSVMFKPGARTFWHSHTNGQLFLISFGRGMVATRDGDFKEVRAGDVVFAPPGEVHWHGAAPDSYVVYAAVSLGTTEWLDEEVADESYEEAWRSAT